MSDLMARLFEESQYNPDCLYWQAADRIRELEAEVARLNEYIRTKIGALDSETRDLNAATGRAVDRAEAAEAKLLEAENINDQMQIANDQLGGELDDLRETLRAVGDLPGKWRKPSEFVDEHGAVTPRKRGDVLDACADELEALLKEGAL